jgi:hypothetical protein
METKPKFEPFTIGPWRTGDVFRTVFGPPNGNPCPEVVASVGNRNTKANAKLIAASPELLEACKLAEANLSPIYPSEHLVMKSLRAAIHKATA